MVWWRHSLRYRLSGCGDKKAQGVRGVVRNRLEVRTDDTDKGPRFRLKGCEIGHQGCEAERVRFGAGIPEIKTILGGFVMKVVGLPLP